MESDSSSMQPRLIYVIALGTEAVSPMRTDPQRRDDRCRNDPRSETGGSDGPHPLHVVSAIRETDDCRRDTGRNEPEDCAANHRDAPTIAAFHAVDPSGPRVPLVVSFPATVLASGLDRGLTVSGLKRCLTRN